MSKALFVKVEDAAQRIAELEQRVDWLAARLDALDAGRLEVSDEDDDAQPEHPPMIHKRGPGRPRKNAAA